MVRPPSSYDEKLSVWATDAGRLKFEHRQRILLAAWGVAPTQDAACVQVPQMWAAADPLYLLDHFRLRDLLPSEAERLRFAMAGHNVPFGRAAAWFTEPRRGVDTDNFFGFGPYTPMHGSHRCHKPHYIVPHDLKYESQSANYSRNDYYLAAIALRKYGHPVPRHCADPAHVPPCLMARAALTVEEAYCI
ncbi:hypothetical protein G647_10427 [Cladophialophora carrionii CBS 160.54]|uniref:Uncharacterized protein n=1 Tax=Cladophialophora carrionii CBS 160.54 TaxID=1279043 RepID=V9DJW9_9EURO|nr:uncharacterized protein G647_10427 [Cladophialophora carrionii CBS 160.54]ETI26613.1 hypothetical protein G647_10427 [Cladophialophora carrionii CBS 160.54]